MLDRMVVSPLWRWPGEIHSFVPHKQILSRQMGTEGVGYASAENHFTGSWLKTPHYFILYAPTPQSHDNT